MHQSTTADQCVAIGYYALESNTTNDYLTAIGHEALTALTTGGSNTAIGFGCLKAVSTGSSNTGVGYKCLSACTAGHNTAMGHDAMEVCTDSPGNTAIGSYTMGNGAASGSTNGYNTMIGYACGYQLTTGKNNTSIGNAAGKELTTGSNNTFLGRMAGMSGSPSGEVSTGDNTVCLGDDSVANLYCADTSISSSDARDKTDIERFTHGLSWINQLSPVTYRWDKRSWYVNDPEFIDDPTTSIDEGAPDGSKKSPRLHVGFLAQEHLEVEKSHGFGTERDNMIITDLTEDGKKYGMKYERLVPVLVNAVKELSAKVEALESKLNN